MTATDPSGAAPAAPATTADPPSPDPHATWAALAATIADLGRLLDGTTGADAAAGLRYAAHFLAAGLSVCVAHDDTVAPSLGRMVEPSMRWGLDNPDCLYLITRLAPDGTYRVHGDRGTATHLELQVNTGHFGDGNYTGWRAVWSATADDLGAGPGQPLDVTIGPAEGSSFLLVRQYFGDWERERPADLVIERLDATAGATDDGLDAVTARLVLLQQWLTAGADCWAALGRGFADGTPGATIDPFVPPAEAAGLKGQAYGFGPFRLDDPDRDAVVLTLAPPPCRLWSVSLADPWWASVDFAHHQSSLNSHQAQADPDGRYTFVIARDDPGVANWLDPAGATRGTLAVRYLLPDLGHDGVPPPLGYRTVPLTDLADALPPGCPRTDPAARADAQRRRAEAVARRYRA